MPSTLRVYNTLTRKLEELAPADPARVTFYTCGPTVYDDAHIGNFRSFLAADTLRRFVESPLCTVRTKDGGTHRGPRQVVHVMNITDVGHMTDDAEGGESGEDRMAVAGKRLLEAKKSGKLPAGAAIDPGNPYDIARFYADRFLEDARTLGLKVAIEQQRDPSLMPRATASIPGMIEVIKTLITRGHAYAVGPAGVDVEVVVPISRPVEPPEGLTIVDLPACDALQVLWVGPYEAMQPVYQAIEAWMAEHGRVAGGPPREVYLTSPGDNLPPEQYRTLVVWPLA